jgi:hypothetical protein
MPAGAPFGNQNGVKGNRWRKALERCLAHEGGELDEGLFKVAAQVVRLALEGDRDAWREIAERMDGKPGTSITVSGDPNAPLNVTWKSDAG